MLVWKPERIYGEALAEYLYSAGHIVSIVNPVRIKAFALRHNSLLKAFSDRLLNRGKVKMQVIGAVMRKLLHMAFGILKSQKPFDPNFLSATP